ncbi:cyclin-D-binding Myb-like transcription factor 1 isoform X3 [Hydra vulgaris]|uniref:Cyclin-D-binding Myb-like transcription factor 1 isoform X3 n=1 Tax=Hydra vulgaris TaxID=6087 RepID=A0ABM4DJD4_HYDVU
MANFENRQKNTRTRKRRSNSDSELVLANYSEKCFSASSPDQKYFFNPSIGINSYAIDDIDISADNPFFNARFTMDPAQMFMSVKEHDASLDISVSSTQIENNPTELCKNEHEYMNSEYLNNVNSQQDFQTVSINKDFEMIPYIQNSAERKDCVNKMWSLMKEDKKNLIEKGLEWKSGLWSPGEEIILQSNITKYCKKNGLSDASIMIFSTPREKRKEFYRSIAIGLNRPLFTIYRKVLRMCNQKNYVGKYTQVEVEKLAELCRIHGNDWATIGHHLGRSPGSVRDKARLLKCHKKRGKWSEDELKHLSDIVHAQTNTKKGESVTVGINWAKVAENIETRTEKQCRSKWLNFLNWSETGGKKWNKFCDLELINKIGNLNVINESKIDWISLAKDWCSVRSPQWLKHRWHGIKKHVPNYQHLTLNNIIGFLQTNYVKEVIHKLNEHVSVRNNQDELVLTLNAQSLVQEFQIEANDSQSKSFINKNQLEILGQVNDPSALIPLSSQEDMTHGGFTILF